VDTFLHHSNTFWVGIEALAVCTYTVFVVVTLWFIFLQVRTASKSFQFGAVCRLQELVDDFREDRHALFATCPLELAMSDDQFPRRPPSRRRSSPRHREKQPMALTAEQTAALRSISDEVRERAMCVIARLNDIGALIEDGFIDRRVVLGKYHVMIIQCCYMVEAVRRDEENRRGGNYGQRLLRMRHWATTYNDVWPKHRATTIEIRSPSGHRVLYKSPSPTLIQRGTWVVRRWLHLY